MATPITIVLPKDGITLNEAAKGGSREVKWEIHRRGRPGTFKTIERCQYRPNSGAKDSYVCRPATIAEIKCQCRDGGDIQWNSDEYVECVRKESK